MLRCTLILLLQLGGFAFIGEGIPIGLGAAFRSKYIRASVVLLPRLYAVLPLTASA